MVERKYDSHTFFITVPHWGIEEHNVIKAMARTCPEEYTIKKFDKQGGISTDYDNYAFFHSFEYETINEEKMRDITDGDKDLICYVKLQVDGRKPIYLKYHSWHNQSKTVMLSYKNLCRLGAVGCEQDEKTAFVSKSCWFLYYWMHNDSGVKLPFRISVIGLAATFVSTLLGIYF